MRAILIDDEKYALDELEYVLQNEPEIKIIDTFTNPIKALAKIKEQSPDVIFLDIDMPVMNGLHLAREILELNQRVEIIFITAFTHYAVDAYEFAAFDYITKPFTADRLHKCIQRLIADRQRHMTAYPLLLEKINRIEKCIKNIDKIVAYNDEEIILLKIKEVLFIEIESGSTFVVTIDKKYRTRGNLDYWEKHLHDQCFFRCHRSFLVNVLFIEKIYPLFNYNYVIKQENSAYEIPISRSRLNELKHLLGI